MIFDNRLKFYPFPMVSAVPRKGDVSEYFYKASSEQGAMNLPRLSPLLALVILSASLCVNSVGYCLRAACAAFLSWSVSSVSGLLLFGFSPLERMDTAQLSQSDRIAIMFL